MGGEAGVQDPMVRDRRVAADLAVAAMALVAWAMWPPALARGSQGTVDVVRCESPDQRRVHCDMDPGQGIYMIRQLSDTPCIRESDWGVDRDGVWVARGCRAEFGRQVAEAGAGPSRRIVRCESRRGGTETCPVTMRGAPVRLHRQISSIPCRQGESWGVVRNGIWVGRGCKAEFELGDRDGGFPPGTRMLTCESRDRLRRFCGISVERGVSLVRQLSASRCEYGQSWGWDADGIWVDAGCRAEFAVDPLEPSGPEQGAGPLE
jgi:hypothetical protein